jgi:hypothetical protein
MTYVKDSELGIDRSEFDVDEDSQDPNDGDGE